MNERDANETATTSGPLAKLHESGRWEDEFGALGPAKPGLGPRQNRAGDFPTGPDVGQRFPDVVTRDHTGEVLDLHKHRDGRPAAFVVYRSAVW